MPDSQQPVTWRELEAARAADKAEQNGQHVKTRAMIAVLAVPTIGKSFAVLASAAFGIHMPWIG